MSRYNFDANHIFIPGYKIYALQWRGPGLSPGTKLSRQQELNAKTVTSLLIIPSVLCGVVLFFSSLDCFVLLCPVNTKLNIVFPVNLCLIENLVRV